MKTYRKYSSIFLDLGTRWRWVVSFKHHPLYPRGKSRRYPLYRRLGGPHSRTGSCGVEKEHLPLPGIEPRTPVAKPTDRVKRLVFMLFSFVKFIYKS
jgi:hypothetical protein